MIEYKITNLDKVRETLRAVPQKLRARAVGNALAAGARLVRDAAKQAAPVLKAKFALRNKYRKVGTLKNAISVRTSKEAKRRGNIGRFVNVRPLRHTAKNIRTFGASLLAGARNPNDPFYWSFINYGWNPASGDRFGKAAKRARRKLSAASIKTNRHVAGRFFMEQGAKRLPEAKDIILSKLRLAVEKLDRGQTP